MSGAVGLRRGGAQLGVLALVLAALLDTRCERMLVPHRAQLGLATCQGARR